MKKLLPIFVLVALTAACDDGRIYLEKDWYLAGGGEQQLFKQMTVAKSDFVGDEAIGPYKSSVTVTSDRTVSRTIWSLTAGGAEKEVLCQGHSLLAGLDYQGFTSLAMEAKIFEYTEPVEGDENFVLCPENFSFVYQISYDLMDGKSANLTSLADTCPFDEAVVAVINKVEELASASITDCTVATAISAVDDEAKEEGTEDEKSEK